MTGDADACGVVERPRTSPRPTTARRVTMRGVRLTSAPLLHLWTHRDARCLGLGVFFHSLGVVGEQVVLGWFILELTDSALMVGIALGLRNFPLLIVGIPAGVIADRGNRVRLLQISGVAMAIVTAALGLLVAVRMAVVWPVLVLTFVTGCARALHQTARQSYAHEIAGGDGLVHALALVALTSRVGGLVGSLLIGFLIARYGSAVAYLVVATGYLASAVAVLPARASARPSATDNGSVGADVLGFLTTIRRDRVLLQLMSLTAIAEVLGFSHQALALGFAPSFAVVLLILVGANALGSATDVLAQTLIQLAVPSGLRGRAGGAWVVSIGMAPLGQFQIGALASLFGVSAALGVNGLALMVVGAAAALLVPRLRKL